MSRIGTNYTNINKIIREIRLISAIRDKIEQIKYYGKKTSKYEFLFYYRQGNLR
ncbi:MAG: hypothetical protein QG641_1186 [Candidatus Poribacteria bacterium]|nr:hypothetical protein [Candidatus Poribacteria bacterium]